MGFGDERACVLCQRVHCPDNLAGAWEDQRTVGKAQKLAYQQKGNNIAASGRCDCVVRISRQFPFCPIA
jgi:hypothetical protein